MWGDRVRGGGKGEEGGSLRLCGKPILVGSAEKDQRPCGSGSGFRSWREGRDRATLGRFLYSGDLSYTCMTSSKFHQKEEKFLDQPNKAFGILENILGPMLASNCPEKTESAYRTQRLKMKERLRSRDLSHQLLKLLAGEPLTTSPQESSTPARTRKAGSFLLPTAPHAPAPPLGPPSRGVWEADGQGGGGESALCCPSRTRCPSRTLLFKER